MVVHMTVSDFVWVSTICDTDSRSFSINLYRIKDIKCQAGLLPFRRKVIVLSTDSDFKKSSSKRTLWVKLMWTIYEF